MPENTNDTTFELYPQSAFEHADSLGIERYIPQKTRDSYDEADFAGPDRSFPVTSQAQLDAAAHLIGHADNPDAVKAKAISIAKRKGFKLPDAWQEDSATEDRVMSTTPPQTAPGDIPADNHPLPVEDNEQDAQRAAMPDIASMYMPIVRIDKSNRTVEGVATSEAIDTFGTIFSYEASKRAFQRWMERTANVREMHQKKAVGRGIGVRFDDSNKKIYVNTYVSRSADGDNAWTKLEEGILGGYSVGADAHSAVWDTITRDGKKYPYLVSYDLAELSLVDNASNPDAHGLLIARADGLTELVDITDPAEEASTPVDMPAAGTSGSSSFLALSTGGTVERVGARVGSGTRSAMHESMGHTLQSLKSQGKNCNCENCQALCAQIGPDGDGDIDIGGGAYGDTGGDAASQAEAERATQPVDIAALLNEHIARIDRTLAPLMQRNSAVLARTASMPDYTELTAELSATESTPLTPELIRSAISAEIQPDFNPRTELTTLKESITSVLERVERASSQSEVRADLSAVKETVERVKAVAEAIAAQPQAGGPVLNGGAFPVDKRLANQLPYAANNQQETRAYWDWAQREGLLTTPEQQMRAAAASIVPIQPRRQG